MSKGIKRESLTSYMQGVEDGQNQIKHRVNNIRGELYKTYDAITQFANNGNLSNAQHHQLANILGFIDIALKQDDQDNEYFYEGDSYDYNQPWNGGYVHFQPHYNNPEENTLVRIARGEEVVTPPVVPDENEIRPRYPQAYIDDDNRIVIPESDEETMARNAMYAILLNDNKNQ